MSKIILTTVFGLCTLFPVLTQAGIPTQEEVTCPVGGETFDIVGTASCSHFSARLMSFSPVSSCDFVTKLPQCPTNKLPMYREFTEDEITNLESFVNSNTFLSNTQMSRYYLAYLTDQHLNVQNKSEQFWLLLQGLWFDTDNTFGNSVYTSAFITEALLEIEQETEENKPYVMAITAFVYVKMGEHAKASKLLDTVRNSAVYESPVLVSYVAAIESCIEDSQSEFCNPTTSIPSE